MASSPPYDGTDGPDTHYDTSGDDTLSGAGNNDSLHISNGRDLVYGGTGPGNGGAIPESDVLYINWGNAATSARIGNDYGWVNTGGDGTFGASTRRYQVYEVEHLNAIAGSGDDYVIGTWNSSDTLYGGAGVDTWSDDFSLFTGALTVVMANLQVGTDQLADGTQVNGFERALLALGAGNDKFRDYGAYDDDVAGGGGDDDLLTSNGRDLLHGQAGANDVINVNWSNATQASFISGASGFGYVDTAGNSDYASSTRRVQFYTLEHLIATTGSGNDRLVGFDNAWDKLNGNGGIDTWVDNFSAFASPLNVLMQQAAGGLLSLPDGTQVRYVERAELVLGQAADTFRDYGPRDDIIEGQGGNDNIGTSNGRDTFHGQGGLDDVLTVNWASANTTSFISGAGGYGFVDTGSGDYSGSSRRVLFYTFEHLDATTGSGADRLVGNDNSWDKLNGGGGVDVWADNFSAFVPALNISMSSAASASGLSLPDGTLVKYVEQAELTLGLGADIFRDYGPRDDIVQGNAGNDDIGTSNGRDTFHGQDGVDDVLTVNWANATTAAFISGASGYGYVDTGSGDYGGSTRRVLFYTFEHLNATTGSGHDRLVGNDNSWDRLNGNSGVDYWVDSFSTYASNLNINMAAAASASGLVLGDGTVIRNIEGAELTLGTRHDIFRDYGVRDDIIQANAGNDDLGTSNGRDLFHGQDGTDTLTVNWASATQRITLTGDGGYGFVDTADGTFGGSARRVQFYTMERLVASGGSGSDSITGFNTGSDTLTGNAGHDALFGLAGADELDGGTGNDTLDGGSGADDMIGGAGNDTYYVDSASDTITEGANQGTDTIVTALTRTLADNFENLQLQGAGNAAGTGNGLNNRISGNDGSNTLQGLGANDSLEGGLGADSLLGGAGNDTLVGGAGNDTMDGGADADVFRMGGSTGVDRINGYQASVDRFMLTGSFTDRIESGGSTRLFHSGGEILVVGVTGLTLAQWNARVLATPAGASEDAPAPVEAQHEVVTPGFVPAGLVPVALIGGPVDFLFA